MPYVGLPWRETGDHPDGVSCWGLARLIYREVLGIDLPSYADRFATCAERVEIAAIIAGATASSSWTHFRLGLEAEFDVVTFRRAGMDTHVGIVCGRGRMLHVTGVQDSAIVDYRTGRWAPRLAGFYRHAKIAEAARAA